MERSGIREEYPFCTEKPRILLRSIPGYVWAARLKVQTKSGRINRRRSTPQSPVIQLRREQRTFPLPGTFDPAGPHGFGPNLLKPLRQPVRQKARQQTGCLLQIFLSLQALTQNLTLGTNKGVTEDPHG